MFSIKKGQTALEYLLLLLIAITLIISVAAWVMWGVEWSATSGNKQLERYWRATETPLASGEISMCIDFDGAGLDESNGDPNPDHLSFTELPVLPTGDCDPMDLVNMSDPFCGGASLGDCVGKYLYFTSGPYENEKFLIVASFCSWIHHKVQLQGWYGCLKSGHGSLPGGGSWTFEVYDS